MKKTLLLIFIMLLLTCLTWAKPISIEQAKQVASNIMVERGTANPVVISNIVDRDQTGQPLFYIFNFRPASFVMVSADDIVVPVLGYSLDQVYSNSNHPVQFDDLLWRFRGQIEYARTNNLSATEEIRNDWLRLNVSASNFTPLNNRDRDVAPILQATWGQGTYYNAYTPSSTPVGCVAVAMGQVMKRWGFPTTGTGTNSYTWAPYGTLSADFGATTYAWSLMPNAISSANSSIATLLYHLGVSVNMMYAPDGSGAYDADALAALRDHFSYKSTLSLKNKSAYTDVNWAALMRTEIDAGRPMYYSGSGPSGGHAFNLDGYVTATNMFHFNWGWNGYYNGYYLLTNLNPGGDTFNSGCSAIIGIEPSAAAGGTLSEGFEGVTAPAIPSSWAINPSATWVTSTATPIAGTNSAYYTLTNTGANFSGKRLITPKLTVAAGNTVSFYAKRGSSARGEIVKVKWTTDKLSYSDFTTAQATPVLTATGTLYSFPVGNYKTGDYYIAFETYSAITTSNAKAIWLDTVTGPPLWINPLPVIALNTTSWNAGNVSPGAVGTSGNVFTITNTGGASLTVTSAVISGTGATKFTTNFNTGTVLQYGQSYSFSFNYEPTTYTTDSATFTLVTNGGTKTIALTGTCQYNIINDGFETYTDFAIDFPPWTNTAVTSSTVYTITGTTFLNQSIAQSYMVFNPSLTTPPLTGDANATHSGSKMAICMSDTDLLNDDYLITQLIPTMSGTATVAFWAKSYTATYGLERFKVQYSTTTNAVASFTNYLAGTATTYVEAPTAWTFYSYALPLTAKYVAIHCVSADAFFLMVDDFYIHDTSTPPAPPTFGNVSGYVYEFGTTNPINNATVTIGLKSATTNASGYYIVNNVLTGTYTMNVTAVGTFYFDASQAGVVITNGVTTAQNFGMKWASIAASPTALTQTLNPFATADQTLTISNPTGTGDLSYSIYMQTSARGNSTLNFRSTGMKQKFANVNASNSARVDLPAMNDDRMSGWADYAAGLTPTTYTWAGPERGVYYTLNDWGLFSNGATLTQLRHTFYENATTYPWGTDTTFNFKIYGPDGTTVLYTSPAITALRYPTVTTFTLPTPMTFTDDFIVVVVPTNATTGMPSSLGSDGAFGNSIVTATAPATGWELADFEFIQGAYIAGDEWSGLSAYSGTIVPGGTQDITVHFDAANLNGITKTANMMFVNNAIYLSPRGDNMVVPMTLTVNAITTPIPVLNTTTWTSITASSTTASSGNVFTLTNQGIGTLTVSSITNLTGTDFSTTFVPAGIALTNGQSYSFGFSYHPTTPGIDNVTFNIVTSNGTKTVTLAGYGDYTLEGFEGVNFPPDGWANIDQDADTYLWYAYSTTGAPYEGLKCAASESYRSAAKSGNGNSRLVLTPDNYLILPYLAINSGDVLKYRVAAQDPAWPAEHYSVKVSTTNANVASFTTELFAETMADGDWHERTIDLSAYAHQDIYIAFEHHSCSDQFLLKLDNVLYPKLAVPLTYGSLKGNVFRSGTTTPIQGATVTINNLTAVTDIDGYYEILNILTGTYDAACTKPTGTYYFGETVTGIVIAADTPTSQDFNLTWAELGVSPTSFDVSAGAGSTADRNLTITNPAGTANLSYVVSLWDTSARSDTPTMTKRRPVVDMSKSARLPLDARMPQTNHDRTYGWYGYANSDDANIYTWAGTERATKYVLQDLGLLRPVTIQQVSSFFYNPTATPWVDATFHFVIYAADGTTVLYTSTDIEATSLTEVAHTLTTPLVVSGDFYVAVVPTDASSSPFTLGSDLYSGNSYSKTAGVWTLSTSEYLNYVYAEGAGWLTVTNGSGTVIPAGSATVGLHFDTAGLTAGASRSCTIAIFNNSDNTTARGITRQIPVTFTITAGGIDAPTGVTATIINDNPVISWNPVSGATSYKVYGSNDPYAADWGAALTTTTSTNYVDLSGLQYHFFKITAVIGAKSSEVNVGKPVTTKK